MKNKLLLLITLLVPTLLFSQKEFKKGYIITSNFQRIDGLIANYGSENSSEDYVFKQAKKDSVFYLTENNTREFGLENSKRFVLANILIEISDSKVEDKADSSEYVLKWIKKNTFIEVLLNGDLATLYYYNYKGIDNFYLQINESRIIPLIYKRYMVKTNNSYASEFIENNAYKEVLYNTLKCKDGGKPARHVNYSKKSLIEFLKKYHECNNSKYTTLYTSKSSTSFNFKASYLLSFTNFGVNDGTTAYYDFSNETNHSFGLEAEYLIPFNNYSISLFLESNYIYYSSSYTNPYVNNEVTKVNYKSIEMPIGINFYLPINENNRLFVRAAFIPYIILDDSYISFYLDNNRFDLTAPSNAYVGAGYSYKRFSVEYRYYSRQNLTSKIEKNTRDSDFDHMSLRFSFTFAKSK